MTPDDTPDASAPRPPARPASRRAGEVPAGLWTKCNACKQMWYTKELAREAWVCRKCGYHFPLSARQRIEVMADPGSFREFDADVHSADPLHFPDYRAKLKTAEAKSELADAFVWGDAAMDGHPIVMGVTDFAFMGGSMGSVLGEKVTRAFERGAATRRPVVLFSASGGARMQEGILSLMQMPKTSAACARLHRAGVPYISVLTHPTTAGVLASYASLADVILAEPGALIGFAGPRVIEQSLREKLPPGTHTAEFQRAHGMVDDVVHRRDLKPLVTTLLRWMA